MASMARVFSVASAETVETSERFACSPTSCQNKIRVPSFLRRSIVRRRIVVRGSVLRDGRGDGQDPRGIVEALEAPSAELDATGIGEAIARRLLLAAIIVKTLLRQKHARSLRWSGSRPAKPAASQR